MSSSTLYRISGWAGILSGLLLLADTLLLDPLLPDYMAARIPGVWVIPLGLLALTGLYLWQREPSGRLGGLGYSIIAVGMVLLFGVVFANNFILPVLDGEVLQALFSGPTRLVFLLSAIVFLIGLILFSLATFRAKIFPWGAVVLFFVGFVPVGLAALLPDNVVNIGQVGAAIGTSWLGYALRNMA